MQHSKAIHPKVSIVLPTHNRAPLLRGAIANIQGQTLSSWELILVDDGSTDETASVIELAVREDQRIRSVTLPTNQKLPRALNAGFALARGAFLTWASDDNSYEPQALGEMAAFLDEHPEIGFVYAAEKIVNGNGELIRTYIPPPASHLVFHYVIGGCFLYRREVAKAVGEYDPDLFLVEDWDFFLRAALATRFHYLDKVLYNYTEHTDSLCVRQATEKPGACKRLLDKHLGKIQWPDKRALAEAYRRRGELAWEHGQKRQFYKDILKSLSLWSPVVLGNRITRERLLLGPLYEVLSGIQVRKRIKRLLRRPLE